jgi:Domain of unknown function (4846)
MIMLLKFVSIVCIIGITGLSTYMYTVDSESVFSNENQLITENDGSTISTRFETPTGYTRIKCDSNSFGAYLRAFQLYSIDHQVLLFDGTEKSNKVHASVLKIDVGKKDLQQCADACMRLRAEYLFKQKKYDEISFDFTNGFTAKYKEWRSGKRIVVKGNSVSWGNKVTSDTSHASFRVYMDKVFTYAGTLSLQNSLSKTALGTLQIGDLLLQGGSPGHTVTIVDMATNQAGQKIVLLAQSYMPAQEIHVLKNLSNPKISPWIVLEENKITETPEWDFQANCFRKW